MTRDSENTLATELPTAGEVADILMKLVQFAGLMDRTAIEKKGQRLRPLPCVTGALEAHGLSEEDWPVAVIRAIECLVTSNGRYPGLNGKFLMRTFALDGHLGSLTSRMEDFVNEEPKWKGRDNTLKAQRSMMLTEFAGVMRSAPNYPCRSGKDPAVEKLAVLLAEVFGDQGKRHERSSRLYQQAEEKILELYGELSGLALHWGVEMPVAIGYERVRSLMLHLYAEAELLPADLTNRIELSQWLGVKRGIFGYSFRNPEGGRTLETYDDPYWLPALPELENYRSKKSKYFPARWLEFLDPKGQRFRTREPVFPPSLVRDSTALAGLLLAPKRSRDTVNDSSLEVASSV